MQTDKVPYLDPQGTSLASWCSRKTLRSVNGQKRRLRESEERLRVLVESALNGIVMVDGNGRILMANVRLGSAIRI